MICLFFRQVEGVLQQEDEVVEELDHLVGELEVHTGVATAAEQPSGGMLELE